MKNLIGVCDTHAAAVSLISSLKDNGFTSKQLSIIGKANHDAGKPVPAAEEEKTEKMMDIAGTETGVGVLAGSALGILTGVGIFAIPGLGFLYGAGALVGAIAGFDFGLIGGGLVSALTVAGVKIKETHQYDEQIKQGKFLVIVQGSYEEVSKAEAIMAASAGVSAHEVHG